MKEIFDENKPTAQDMNLDDEFVYAVRVVDMAKKVNLTKECDCDELIRVVSKIFLEYKNKIKNEN